MELVMTLSVGVGSAVFGFLLKWFIDNQRNKNPLILSPSQARQIGIDYSAKDYTHIFVGKRSKIIEKATKMHSSQSQLKNEWEDRLDKNMKLAESVREDLKYTIDKARKEKNKGIRGNAFFTEGAPKLQKLRDASQNISNCLNMIQQFDNHIKFLQQVESGCTKRQTIDNMTDRHAITMDIDLKMDEIFDALNDSLELSTSSERSIERLWLSESDDPAEE
tara:strand:+ start:213 stop:872 length:660 start_codon:yes stop_codon:yes gene_type:complete